MAQLQSMLVNMTFIANLFENSRFFLRGAMRDLVISKLVISKKEIEIDDIFTELMIHTFIYLDKYVIRTWTHL